MSDFMEQHNKNAQEQAQHKARMKNDWDGLIDDIVQEGQNKGLFDNLPGKGKPLNLNRNAFAAGQELANSILKENDVPPAWIMDRTQILAERDALRVEMKKKWHWFAAEFEEAVGDRRGRLTIRWDDACLAWQTQIGSLNKRIQTYNLKRPSANLEIYKLSLEDELKRAGASRWLR